MIGKTTQQELVLKFVVFMNIQAVKVEAYIFYYIKEPFLVVLCLISCKFRESEFFFTKVLCRVFPSISSD